MFYVEVNSCASHEWPFLNLWFRQVSILSMLVHARAMPMACGCGGADRRYAQDK